MRTTLLLTVQRFCVRSGIGPLRQHTPGIAKALIPMKYLSKKDISKETVLVTGAGSGIGRALAMQLAKYGCKLVLWDINKEGNQETAAEIRKFGGRAHTYTVDLSKREQVYSAAEKVRSEAGIVGILVNNAGIITGKKLMECSDACIEKSLQVNTMAHFWTTRAFLPDMLDQDHGHLVSIASIAGVTGSNALTDYCASKFAAIGFLESLSLDLQSRHSSVITTVVCPYIVNTGFVDGATTRFPLLLPILETDFVVKKIVEAIQTNQHTLYIPKILYLLTALKGFLPVKVTAVVYTYLGLDKSMDHFTENRNLVPH